MQTMLQCFSIISVALASADWQDRTWRPAFWGAGGGARLPRSSPLFDCAASGNTQQLHRQHSFWTAFTWTHCTLYSLLIASMKTSILAAAGFASSALAGVHRMKLEKIPLEQQLVSKSSLIQIANLHIN